MPQAFAFSPHLDDAAFSCGGTLARLAQTGWEVTICTAFTASVPEPTGFALDCQLDKGLPASVDYMALRRAEDAAACMALGARPLWLPFAEAPHRGYESVAALFGAPANTDGIATQLAEALRPLLAGAELVLAPQAIGGHVDHVRAVEALRMTVRPDVPILWWTDWPYASRPESHPVRPFASWFESLPVHEICGDESARRDACAAYASQLGFQFGGMAELEAALAAAGPCEAFRLQRSLP